MGKQNLPHDALLPNWQLRFALAGRCYGEKTMGIPLAKKPSKK
jgi:hypothetical protein